ncbi:MAG TPA: DUF2382 domain-containing protein [Bryobacteraceae bacterium]|jgi:uncharacterized protein (TIGR02271 family)|nr:DUF2382 domain-containing protein [Bryobacteraceae bacterium]
MPQDDNEVVIPVVGEEAHAGALPVETGAVRVTKRVVGDDEVLEQQLRKERVEVKRVKVDKPVDGPQQPYRSGNTLIVPVMAQVLQVEKRWVVTEEIHITKYEEQETARQTVTVGHEEAQVERVNEAGETVETIPARAQVLKRREEPDVRHPEETAKREVLRGPRRSIIRDDRKP